jgi:hypothetical protein
MRIETVKKMIDCIYITNIQFNNWMRIETMRVSKMAWFWTFYIQSKNWMRIETWCLQALYQPASAYIQSYNWMRIETTSDLGNGGSVWLTSNLTIGWGLKRHARKYCTNPCLLSSNLFGCGLKYVTCFCCVKWLLHLSLKR